MPNVYTIFVSSSGIGKGSKELFNISFTSLKCKPLPRNNLGVETANVGEFICIFIFFADERVLACSSKLFMTPKSLGQKLG